MMKPFFLLIFLALPSLLWGTPIEGRVVYREAPLSGMRVEAHRSLDFASEPVAVSRPTDEDGLYRLDLPAGDYVLYGRDEARSLFAYCGRIPVAVGEEAIWAGLQAVPTGADLERPYDDDYSASIEGVLLFDGKPLEGGYVHLYLDAGDDLKGQGYRLSMPTSKDGTFAFDGLPESGYYLVARKRATAERVGPILEGDYLALYHRVVPAVAGKVTTVRLQAVRKVKEETDEAGVGTFLRGVVTDPQGRPLSGLHVFAYTDRVIGHQRPVALSSPTTGDGAFALRLKTGGTYYIGARQHYGDSPAPGELFGMYDETADHGLTVKTGENFQGLKIAVEPITLNGM